jgi:hypothetical protein
MPLIEDEPPQPLPRGHHSRRPSRCGSGSVQKPQLKGPLALIRLPTPAGMWMRVDLSGPPASSSSTLCAPSSVNRLASTHPAEPAPMTM